MTKPFSIAVVAPASRLPEEAAARVQALAQRAIGDRLKLFFHPQCFFKSGHFAGTDELRSKAFFDVANDRLFDAVWFARGGYGACRLDEALFDRLNEFARRKIYMGYSDIGFVLARLCTAGVGKLAHGPMPSDVNRGGGDAAVLRALAFLIDRDEASIEPAWRLNGRFFAFNLTVLDGLLAAGAAPDFSGATLMLEDVDEHHYRIDRTMFAVTSNANVRKCAGIRLGRMSGVPPNDPAFEKDETEIFQYWCARAGIPFLGRADIGHDADNKVVPFPSPMLNA